MPKICCLSGHSSRNRGGLIRQLPSPRNWIEPREITSFWRVKLVIVLTLRWLISWSDNISIFHMFDLNQLLTATQFSAAVDKWVCNISITQNSVQHTHWKLWTESRYEFFFSVPQTLWKMSFFWQHRSKYITHSDMTRRNKNIIMFYPSNEERRQKMKNMDDTRGLKIM